MSYRAGNSSTNSNKYMPVSKFNAPSTTRSASWRQGQASFPQSVRGHRQSPSDAFNRNDRMEAGFSGSLQDQENVLRPLSNRNWSSVYNQKNDLDDRMDVTESAEGEWKLMHEKPNIVTTFRTPGLKFRPLSKIILEISDYFNTLPDEVVAHVFTFLPKKDLCRTMGVSRRFNRIGLLQTWRSVDLGNRTIDEDALVNILKRNVTVLRMADTNVIPGSPTILLNLVELRLTHLDLSRTTFSNPSMLVAILSKCKRLQCLSLENQNIDDTICYAIAQNPSLTHLDLSLTRGLQQTGTHYVCQGCQRLEELNLSWCGVNSSIMQVLVAMLPYTMRHLNMAGVISKEAYTPQGWSYEVYNKKILPSYFFPKFMQFSISR
ncbi:hypothetical protein WR25_03932 [Diploscapter pachys]|uniref:F-box domain-containing protein n=1 Tax=Diploscapter pachys TaxID=2018661 RepID=A0A2A2J1V5_9BILA|nr:hypothetical protein WR25_03932 [Diploscapter pachys]